MQNLRLIGLVGTLMVKQLGGVAAFGWVGWKVFLVLIEVGLFGKTFGFLLWY